MKQSLLKWAHHLGKGTTWGYATGKDYLAMLGFMFLLSMMLGIPRHLFSSYCLSAIGFEKEPELIVILTSDFALVYLATAIAYFSMIFMRINDISGKRCFTSKLRVIAFIAIFHSALWFEQFILKSGFPFLLIFHAIMCVCPSASGEREEMPIVEYKLPKKTILVLSCACLAIYLFSMYAYVLFAKTFRS